MCEGHIKGAGIDLVENARMRDMLKRWGPRFKNRVFLQEEQRYCDSKAFPCNHYAGRFAVKEAVSKAFGTGVGPYISWLDIEVIKDPVSGAPSVCLKNKALELAASRSVDSILISFSHTRNYAVAHALLVSA